MRLIRDYMQNAAARAALGALTQAAFGFDFEAWAARGFCVRGAYVPYSFEEDGRILSNVSVNRMEFCLNGEKRRWLQLGTVATREDMRGRGLARRLMEIALADSMDGCDGVYLFANPEAAGFYEKCGFIRGIEYRSFPREEAYLNADARLSSMRERGDSCAEACLDMGARFVPVNPGDERALAAYQRAVRETEPYAALWQENGFGLAMFYTMNAENAYYCPALDAYAVVEDGSLNAVFAQNMPPLRAVLAALAASENVETPTVIGFTPRPEDADACVREPWDGGDDYRLYGCGRVLEEIAANWLCFPALSHA
ncbi:MAG: GNAT family N-acetyltransferase [Clostridia bacterium]|nr:GNAT family N-acetyltransferase [Clostridia bacterium]